MTNEATFIYVVLGSCGEYDDRNEWMVVAYRDEKLAQEHALQANTESRRIEQAIGELDREDWEHFNKNERALIESNIYDPSMADGYPRAGYNVYAIELVTALPIKEAGTE